MRDSGADSPQTALEARVTALFATLLQVEPVGMEENLSLLGAIRCWGAQLLARVLDRFGGELSFSTLSRGSGVWQIAGHPNDMSGRQAPSR